MNWLESLRSFDGKKTQVLEGLATSLPREPATVAWLFEQLKLREVRVQIGVTWILNRWSQEGTLVGELEWSTIRKCLEQNAHWEISLHLLQLLSRTPLDQAVAKRLGAAMERLTEDENKMVRAWACSAFAAAAEAYGPFREACLQRLAAGEVDQAAAVKARIRQIRKQYKWA